MERSFVIWESLVALNFSIFKECRPRPMPVYCTYFSPIKISTYNSMKYNNLIVNLVYYKSDLQLLLTTRQFNSII